MCSRSISYLSTDCIHDMFRKTHCDVNYHSHYKILKYSNYSGQPCITHLPFAKTFLENQAQALFSSSGSFPMMKSEKHTQVGWVCATLLQGHLRVHRENIIHEEGGWKCHCKCLSSMSGRLCESAQIYGLKSSKVFKVFKVIFKPQDTCNSPRGLQYFLQVLT